MQTAVETMYRRRQLTKLLGVSTATLYRWMDRGLFPKPIRYGENVVAWPESVVAAWQRERMVEAGHETQ